MSKFVICFYGSSGDGYVSCDYRPCVSLDMAMTFDSKKKAEEKKLDLQNVWLSDLFVSDVSYVFNED